MQLNISNPGLVTFLADDKSTYHVLLDKQGKIPSEINDYVCAPIETNSKNTISYPGEYEYGQLNVIALEKKEQNIGVANIFKINIDGVNVLALPDKVEALTGEDLSTLGQVDILLCGENFTEVGIDKLMKKLDLSAIVIAGSVDKEEVKKSTGVEVNEESSKLKFDRKDFQQEAANITLYILRA